MEKYDKAVKELINEMFRIAGHNVTFEDIKDRKDDWYLQWTMTREEYDEWIEFGIEYLRKKFRWNKSMAKKEMGMVGLNWGLKFSKTQIY